MNPNELYAHYLSHPSICTDTRAIKTNCLFFALRGEHFDGNQYASQAIHLGAAYAIVDDPTYRQDDRYILVRDVLSALQDLARVHRQQLHIPIIGITGSNGKTTSKELVNAVLSQHYRTLATVGNLNNHIGVPLTILSIQPDTAMAVIEMGTSHPGDLDLLCSIAQPTHGLVTSIGKAHLEDFGDIAGVMAGKGELYAYLRKTNGTVFINRDNPLLLEMSRHHALEHLLYYGTGIDNDIQGELIDQSQFLKIRWRRTASDMDTHVVQSSLVGFYNLENILAAISVGHFFNLSVDEINAGIESYHPKNNRSQLLQTPFNTVICDCYNANPTSTSAALQNLSVMSVPNKVIILGDMLDLGDHTAKEHQEIIQKANRVAAIQRIFIGEEFYKCKDTVNQFYRNTNEALEALGNHAIQNATILVKGSGGMKLERLLPLL